jgi:hypothetical protein
MASQCVQDAVTLYRKSEPEVKLRLEGVFKNGEEGWKVKARSAMRRSVHRAQNHFREA